MIKVILLVMSLLMVGCFEERKITKEDTRRLVLKCIDNMSIVRHKNGFCVAACIYSVYNFPGQYLMVVPCPKQKEE